jgi:hypothetical protein
MPPEPSAIATLGWVARAKAIAAKSFHAEALDWLAAKQRLVLRRRLRHELVSTSACSSRAVVALMT